MSRAARQPAGNSAAANVTIIAVRNAAQSPASRSGFDPLVLALARYVTALDAHYPGGPQDLPCDVPAGRANMPSVLTSSRPSRP